MRLYVDPQQQVAQEGAFAELGQKLDDKLDDLIQKPGDNDPEGTGRPVL